MLFIQAVATEGVAFHFVEYSYRRISLLHSKRQNNSISTIIFILVVRLGLPPSTAPRTTPDRPSSKPAAGQIMARRSASLLH